ncbi:HNH endonuclease [Salmonella enterica]|nr:HNH endonuclease [Salmonella enterica]
MNYADEYAALISNALMAYGRPTSYYAKRKGFDIHHVKPCCAFPHGRDDARANDPSNLAYLPFEEHAKAHFYLARMYPDNRGLQFAWNNMNAKALQMGITLFEDRPFYETEYGYTYSQWINSPERFERVLNGFRNKPESFESIYSGWNPQYPPSINSEDVMERAVAVYKAERDAAYTKNRERELFINRMNAVIEKNNAPLDVEAEPVSSYKPRTVRNELSSMGKMTLVICAVVAVVASIAHFMN